MTQCSVPDRLACLGYVGRVVEWLASDADLDVHRLTAIVNSHEQAGDALRRLAAVFDWGALCLDGLEIQGIDGVTADDYGAARALGSVIKPIVHARRHAEGVDAFVGPALLSDREPLAALDGRLNGIQLDGRHVSRLFFSGPSGQWSEDGGAPCRARGLRTASRSPITSWFLRLTFPGIVPGNEAVVSLAGTAGLDVERLVPMSTRDSRWLAAGEQSREQVHAACARLWTRHRISALALRRIRCSTESPGRIDCTNFANA